MTLIPELPTPVPQSTDPVNFPARADAFLSALPGFATAANAQAQENNLAASNAVAAAAAAAASSANGKAAADQAMALAGAGRFVGTTNYLQGDLAWSPANGLIYRRLVAGRNGVDPSLDAVNWELARNLPVGAAANQVPAGQDLARDAFGAHQSVLIVQRHTPDSRPGDIWREYVNDTTTTIKFHGFDGVIRSRTESWT